MNIRSFRHPDWLLDFNTKQYKGKLTAIREYAEIQLSTAAITGLSDCYKIFRNSSDIGTVLIFFIETGFAHFVSSPVNELFNLSLSLDNVFEKNNINDVEEKLTFATADKQRIN